MRKIRRVAIVVVLSVTALAALLVLSMRTTEAARPPGPRCECADIDAPVICDGGRVYSNPCVANCFHATGCVPYGG
jgi:hypothetical protein